MNKPTRTPWGDFPAVIRQAEFGATRREQDYVAAKQGSRKAARSLVFRMLKQDVFKGSFAKIKELFGDSDPIVVPVQSCIERRDDCVATAFAEIISRTFKWERTGDIVTEKSNTGKPPLERMAGNPEFEGIVKPGRNYLIVDDQVIFGGTVANLRGFIESRGGKAVGATVLTAHEDSVYLPPSAESLQDLRVKHGPALDEFLQEFCGYGADMLTQAEVTYLNFAPSADAIKRRFEEMRRSGRDILKPADDEMECAA